jgi:hypothetical protein
VKCDIGWSDERERLGYTYAESEDPLLAYFPDGGWVVDKDIRSTGGNPGRPKTTISTLDATIVYVMDVAEEVLMEYAEALDHFTGAKREKALELVCKIILARSPAANPRVMAQAGRMSARTYYRWKKEGQMFLDQLDRIEKNQLRMENKIDHFIATTDLRSIQMFRAMGELDDEADLELDSEA